MTMNFLVIKKHWERRRQSITLCRFNSLCINVTMLQILLKVYMQLITNVYLNQEYIYNVQGFFISHLNGLSNKSITHEITHIQMLTWILLLLYLP